MTPDLEALVAFLRARLDEREREVRESLHWRGDPCAVPGLHLDPDDALREVDAHRRIVDACVPHVIRADDCGQLARGTLFALALPHSFHLDYREEWRP